MSLLKQLRAIFLLPFLVTILLPGVFILSGSYDPGWSLDVPYQLLPTTAGLIFVCCGMILLIATVYLFITRGEGTLAPWDPPRHLVVQGVYRHVRNPMISGVLLILLGESVLLGSWGIFFWFLFFLAANLIYIPLSEEPGLVRRFGSDYEHYRRNVPAWLPRLRAWEGMINRDETEGS